MLFLGTEKYPSESEYQQFLSDHEGSSNAFTASEDTNYYFDISPGHFKGALDRFAQFFICPLLNGNSSSRELQAVNNEHEKNLQTDGWRIMQLLRSTSNPRHPFHKVIGHKEG